MRLDGLTTVVEGGQLCSPFWAYLEHLRVVLAVVNEIFCPCSRSSWVSKPMSLYVCGKLES